MTIKLSSVKFPESEVLHCVNDGNLIAVYYVGYEKTIKYKFKYNRGFQIKKMKFQIPSLLFMSFNFSLPIRGKI